MLSLFSIIQNIFNYVNLNVILKNRIYTILAFLGNFYLLYVAFKFYLNGYIFRSSLFILAFIFILYFSYLNMLYYFTKNKRSKFDISPIIEKLLHIQAKDPIDDDIYQKNEANVQNIQSNGIFKNEKFLPATITYSKLQQINIQQVIKELVKMNYLHLNFGGLTNSEIKEKILKNKSDVLALNKPVTLPYFQLVKRRESIIIYGGINEIRQLELGTVKDIGLLTSLEAQRRYDLYLVTVIIMGGPRKSLGRSGIIEKDYPFYINAQIAYRKK